MSSGYIGEAFGAAQRAREIVEQLKAERARQVRALRILWILIAVNISIAVLNIIHWAWS